MVRPQEPPRRAPKRSLIERAAQVLGEAGFAVDVAVDATPGERAAGEGRRARRARDRAARLSARASWQQARADARADAAQAITERVPFGQPILLGHHSQARAQRDAAKVHGHVKASREHQVLAEAAAGGARAAAAATAARIAVTIANRIERIAADIRRDERRLDAREVGGGAETSTYRQALRERLAVARADLEHWQGVRARQLADGTATNYSRDTVRPGDVVKIRGHWHTVARVNAKTVAVQTEYSWTTTNAVARGADHRAAAGGRQQLGTDGNGAAS